MQAKQEPVDWPSDWLRATLGMCALRALESGPSYGYAIISALAGAGLGTIKGGTLYPLLTRFEAAGWVATEWRPGEGGPGRKYFSLTADGRRTLAEQREAWRNFTHTTTGFLNSPEHAGQGA
ncbi:PadR family transcriptional regulator [Paeniglutamicibacter cryotolerans]|uniref:PadR family transcriptional regulator PadR n=1 Tax=Paeniglutamicibacter cryotolerans TaxID=670079 RepID=A0A839QES0_9MICC|nr:PadR family transcriptional regulator [Paeniglutamicibacter cryotolerans]MBB2994127.1 PadR family transcriptional regulator PadR [Paeniglutamicibacter cryotolerans]